jgi:hypothetical protein
LRAAHAPARRRAVVLALPRVETGTVGVAP